MRLDVARDLSASASDFSRVVWPAIAHACGGGEIEPVESVTAQGIAKSLDVLSGIDAWQIIGSVGIRGIASRVQWGTKDWGTFTVRYSRPNGTKTEWHKIQEVANLTERGFIRCHLVVQAYLYGKRGERCDLIAAHIIQAPDLYRLCQNNLEGEAWYKKQVEGGEEMAVFKVDKLRAHGARVKTITP